MSKDHEPERPMDQTEEGRFRESEQVRRSRRRAERIAMSDSVDQEARDTAEDALSASITHEILCNERWKNQLASMARIERSLDAVKTAIDERIGKIPAGIIAVMGTIIGWLAARAFPTP